jgi:hypothetical protein
MDARVTEFYQDPRLSVTGVRRSVQRRYQAAIYEIGKHGDVVRYLSQR